jgi:hypothetical protein
MRYQPPPPNPLTVFGMGSRPRSVASVAAVDRRTVRSSGGQHAALRRRRLSGCQTGGLGRTLCERRRYRRTGIRSAVYATRTHRFLRGDRVLLRVEGRAHRRGDAELPCGRRLRPPNRWGRRGGRCSAGRDVDGQARRASARRSRLVGDRNPPRRGRRAVPLRTGYRRQPVHQASCTRPCFAAIRAASRRDGAASF